MLEGEFKMLDLMIKRRKYLRLTQKALADLCGCSQNTISSIENGQYMPRITLAYKICWVMCYEQYEITPDPDDFISHDQLLLITFRAFFKDYIAIANIQLDECYEKVYRIMSDEKSKC